MKTQNANTQSTSPALPQGWAVQFSQCGFDFRLHQAGREFDQCRVLVYLKRLIPSVWPLAEVVGGWVWVEYPYSPADQVCSQLFELGFHWNQRRRIWQHPGAQFGARVRAAGESLRYLPAQLEVFSVPRARFVSPFGPLSRALLPLSLGVGAPPVPAPAKLLATD